MTIVRDADTIQSDVVPDNTVSDIITADDISSDDISTKEAASDDSSASDPDSDPKKEENADPENEDNPAGIFTSYELSDEIKMRITGKSYAEGCTIPYEDLRYLQLSYVDFNGETKLGEMICNKAVAADLLDIFSELYHNGYQIDKIRLIDDYNADDDASCDDDNTSCFCYRVVAGSANLSKHAQGVAVDINPFYNPYVTYPNGKIRISPVGSEAYADRSADFPHKIDENDLAYKLFTKHGFTWGGHWKTLKDYQHFQKPL
ncbi:MAG: M15 family metallopeptidase [Lachnospiraceae bacterium]|nr:M15 family metallopeptidase [Lachnospiraceae bacterium]